MSILLYSALIKSLNYWDNKSLLTDELENQQYLKDLFAVMEKRVPAAHCQATMTLNCKWRYELGVIGVVNRFGIRNLVAELYGPVL